MKKQHLFYLYVAWLIFVVVASLLGWFEFSEPNESLWLLDGVTGDIIIWGFIIVSICSIVFYVLKKLYGEGEEKKKEKCEVLFSLCISITMLYFVFFLIHDAIYTGNYSTVILLASIALPVFFHTIRP